MRFGEFAKGLLRHVTPRLSSGSKETRSVPPTAPFIEESDTMPDPKATKPDRRNKSNKPATLGKPPPRSAYEDLNNLPVEKMVQVLDERDKVYREKIIAKAETERGQRYESIPTYQQLKLVLDTLRIMAPKLSEELRNEFEGIENLFYSGITTSQLDNILKFQEQEKQEQDNIERINDKLLELAPLIEEVEGKEDTEENARFSQEIYVLAKRNGIDVKEPEDGIFSDAEKSALLEQVEEKAHSEKNPRIELRVPLLRRIIGTRLREHQKLKEIQQTRYYHHQGLLIARKQGEKNIARLRTLQDREEQDLINLLRGAEWVRNQAKYVN